MKILGISAFYHDAAAALIVDGQIVAAAQEERFTRKKHDSGFPSNAVRFCLEFAKIRPDQLDQVAFYDKPFLKFERLLETYLAFAPRGFTSFKEALPLWLKEKLFQKSLLAKALRDAIGNGIDWQSKLLFSEHHLSHAAQRSRAAIDRSVALDEVRIEPVLRKLARAKRTREESSFVLAPLELDYECSLEACFSEAHPTNSSRTRC